MKMANEIKQQTDGDMKITRQLSWQIVKYVFLGKQYSEAVLKNIFEYYFRFQ